MRALQERHIAVQQRDYVERKLDFYRAHNDTFYSQYSPLVVEPIAWIFEEITTFPLDGELDSLTFSEWLEQLSQLRNYYNSLRGKYVFPANSTQSADTDLASLEQRASILRVIEPINESNFEPLIGEMASGLNQMKYLVWPLSHQHGSYYEYDMPLGVAGQPEQINIGVSLYADEVWDYNWQRYAKLDPDHHLAEFGILDSYSITVGLEDRMSAAYYSGQDSGDFVWPKLAPVSVGTLFFTGNELGNDKYDSIDGQFTLLGRQWPTAGVVSEFVSLNSGTWPNGYQEFKGYKPIAVFSSDSEKLQYNAMDYLSMGPPQNSNFATGTATGYLNGNWENISESDSSVGATYFLEGYSPFFTGWEYNSNGYGSREDLGPIPGFNEVTYSELLSIEVRDYMVAPYHQTSGILLFEPSFNHTIEFAEAVYSVPASENIGVPMVDLRRQIAYIDIGRGIDGLGQGFIGFGPATNKSRHFDGLGQVIDLSLITESGDFEVYYELSVGEFPGSLNSAMADEYVYASQGINGGAVSDITNSAFDYYNPFSIGSAIGLFYPKMEWYLHPRIKQVVGRDVVVNVIPTGSGASVSETSYRIEFFHASQKGVYFGGKYTVTGLPFNVIKIVDQGPSASSPKFTMTEESTAESSPDKLNKKITVEYEAEDASSDWYYFGEEGDQNNANQSYIYSLEKQEVYTKYNFKNFIKVVTENIAGPIAKIEESYDQDSYTYTRKVDEIVVSQLVYPDEDSFYRASNSPLVPLFVPSLLVNSTVDGGRIVEYSSSLAPFSYITSSTGPNAFTQEYDAYGDGRLTERSETHQGVSYITRVTTVGNTVKAEVEREGATISRSWRVYEEGMRKVTETVATSTNADGPDHLDTLSTVTTFYGGNEGDLPWAVKSIQYPDDQISRYTYSHANDQLTTIIATGPNETQTTTETTIITNEQGYLVSSTTEEGSVTVASSVANFHDDWGRPTQITYLDGTFETFTYEPNFQNRLISHTSRTGQTTSYTHDILGRIRTIDGAEVDVTYEYDGFETTATYTPGGYEVTTTTDAFGELESATSTFEAASNITVAGDTYTTTNNLTGITRVEDRNSDGSLSAVSGSSVEASTVEYGTVSDPQLGTLTFVKRGLDSSRTTVSEASTANNYVTTYYDAAGRVVRVEEPHAIGAGTAETKYTYNDKGQLLKITAPPNDETIFAYDLATGRRNGVTYPGNITVSEVVEFANGKQVTTTTQAGQIIRKVEYDPAELETIIRPLGITDDSIATTIDLDIASGYTTNIQTPTLESEYTYDASGHLVSGGTIDRSNDLEIFSIDPVSTSVDAYGRLEAITQVAFDRETSATFEKSGLPATVTTLGHTSNFNINHASDDHTISYDTPEGTVSMAINDKGELNNLSRPGYPAIDLDFSIDSDGQSLELTTTGATTTFEYGHAGQFLSKDYTDNTSRSVNERYANGLAKTVLTARGEPISYSYNDSYQLTQINYSPGSTPLVELDYNAAGQGRTLNYIEDAAGKLEFSYNDTFFVEDSEYTQGDLSGLTIDRTLDTFKRVEDVAYQNVSGNLGGSFENLHYDYFGNTSDIQSITADDFKIIYKRDSLTNRVENVEIRYQGSQRVEVDYDWGSQSQHARLQSIKSRADAMFESDVNFDYTLDYEGAGRRIKKVDMGSSLEWSFDYDENGYLEEGYLEYLGGRLDAYDFTYDFDTSGNRIGSGRATAYYHDYHQDVNNLNQTNISAIPGAIFVHGYVDVDAEVKVLHTFSDNPVVNHGNWTLAGSYLQAPAEADNEGGWVDYRVELAAGSYDLSLAWPGDNTHASKVPVIITTEDQRILKHIDQTVPAASGQVIHSLTLAETTQVRIRLNNVYTDGAVIAGSLSVKNTSTNQTSTTPVADLSYNEIPAFNVGGYYQATIGVDNVFGAELIDVIVLGTLQSQDPNKPLPAIAELDAYSVYVPKADASATDYVYDASGNLEQDTRWTYTWDTAGNLTSLDTRPQAILDGLPDLRLEFKYDSSHRRFKKTVYEDDAVQYTRYFMYDGWNLVAELDENRDVLRSYIWGKDISGGQAAGGIGGLLAITDHETGEGYIPVHNFRGDIVALVDGGNGSVVARYDYGPFGEPIGARGPAVDVSPFRYSSKYHDSETGFAYFGYRYYNAEAGQWLSREPLGEGESPNLYAYADNDPINNIDVLGLYKDPILIDDAEGVWEIFANEVYSLGAVGDYFRWSSDQYIGYSNNSNNGVVKTFATNFIGNGIGIVGGIGTPGTYGEGAEAFGTELGEVYTLSDESGASAVSSAWLTTRYGLTSWNVGAIYEGYVGQNPLTLQTYDGFERALLINQGFVGTAAVALPLAQLTAQPVRAGLGTVLKRTEAPLSRGAYLRQKHGTLSTAELHQRINLRGAVAEQFAKGGGRGPVLSGVLDTQTGHICYGFNGAVPAKLHTTLAARLMARSVDDWAALYHKSAGAGTHAEFVALNEALLTRPNASIGEFMIYNLRRNGSRRGQPIPRCPHCETLTDGAQFIPEALKFNPEYKF